MCDCTSELSLPLSLCSVLLGDGKGERSGRSFRKVSLEWLQTLCEDTRTNNRNNAPSLETITAANNEKQLLAYENCYTSEEE